MATLSFDRVTKVATVAAPDTSISCQEILDQFRNFEDEPESMGYPQMIDAAGKIALAGGALTVVTITLLDGWRIAFESRAGPGFTQCVVTGGNIVGRDENGADQFPLAPTNFVFASIAQATTGALLGSLAPEFQGGIWIDTVNGVSGTAFPTGTSSAPVNNVADAKTIANSYGLTSFFVLSDISNIAADMSGFDFSAKKGRHLISFSAGSVATGCSFTGLSLTGALSGAISGTLVHFEGTTTGVQGDFHESGLAGTITLDGDTNFVDCFSDVAGVGTAIINGAGVGTSNIQFRRFTGGLTLNTVVTGDNVSVDLLPGRLILTSSVTGGNIKIRGVGEFVENGGTPDVLDTDGFNPVDATLMSEVQRGRKWLTNRESLTAAATNNRVIYDDDGVTPFETQTVLDKDGNPIQIDVGVPAQRSVPS